MLVCNAQLIMRKEIQLQKIRFGEKVLREKRIYFLIA